jgi:YfiH family protein
LELNRQESFIAQKNDDLIYYEFASFKHTGKVLHGFSTRMGGVSTGECSTLNLGIRTSDKKEAVMKNFEIFLDAIGIKSDYLVFSDQIHSDKIAIVSQKDRGKGIYRQSDLLGIDGFVTNQPGVALTTFYADCVPLFFLDPEKKVIALSHSGWKGTVSKIGKKTLATMINTYGTNPSDCLIGIGPSIGPCCFEVDSPVADAFQKAFHQHKYFIEYHNNGKYFIDLWKVNYMQFIEMGVPKNNITCASICTCCNNDIFFSYRAEKGHTGRMAAVLMIV